MGYGLDGVDGTYDAIQHLLYTNDLEHDWYVDHFRYRQYQILKKAGFEKKSQSTTIRELISKLSLGEIIGIAKWMIEKEEYGNSRFKLMTSRIIRDFNNGQMTKLSQKQRNCVIGFIRKDLLEIPNIF